MKHLFAVVAVTLALLADPASAADTRALEAEIRRLSAPAGGVVGVAAWRLDGDGPRVLVNGGQRFPMASTFKVAIAGALLAAVDDGRLSLEQMVSVAPDAHIPSAIIADRFIHPGVSLSLANLMELMLTQSDNTATDIVMELAGGPARVTEWVRAQGIENLRVDRDTGALLRDFFELPDGPFLEALTEAEKADPQLVQKGAHPNPHFYGDVRDTSTPEAMAGLLTRIFNGRALSPRSTELLIGMMQRCRTGEGRLKGRLPAGTEVAHKTGTIGGTLNDVGVISLPGDAGQLVVAVLIRESGRPFADREQAIAEIARTLRDYYLLADIR